ncbi:MAG: TRAP transporter substrate-binding protein [Betaproteobacteria bacterium]|nr:MAG: TRAP transporter substrate-binding protein [Betaproteobacteria bacterium]
MKSKSGLLAVLASGMILGLAGAPGALAAKTEVVFAHVFPAVSLEQQASQRFAKGISERTKGEVEVKIFPASQLGGFAQIATQQRSGAVHGTIISTTALGSYAPLATVDSWPYLFHEKAQFDRAYASAEGRAFLDAIEKASGYRILAPMYKGKRHVYVRRPVSSMDGLKLRVPGLPVVLDTFKAWGVTPTPLGVAEMFPAMQQGVVDGAEIELQTAETLGLASLTKTVLMTGHMMPNYAWIFFGKWLDGQPAAVRTAIEASARETSEWFAGEMVKEEKQSLEKFRAAGAQIREVNTAELEKKATQALTGKYPELAAWVKRLQAAGGK